MLGIYADPVQQLKQDKQDEYDKVVATIATHNANNIVGLPEKDLAMPTAKTFMEDPVTEGKLFVALISKTNTFDADQKVKTSKAMQKWLKGEIQIYGHAVQTLVKATHLIYQKSGAGRQQLANIKASVVVHSKQATQALLINLKHFKYDKITPKDSLTKGEGIDRYLQRLEGLITALASGKPPSILNEEQKYLAYVDGLSKSGVFGKIVEACETNNQSLKEMHDNIKRVENKDAEIIKAMHSTSKGKLSAEVNAAESDLHEIISNIETNSSGLQICTNFISEKGCSFGNKCRHIHISVPGKHQAKVSILSVLRHVEEIISLRIW